MDAHVLPRLSVSSSPQRKSSSGPLHPIEGVAGGESPAVAATAAASGARFLGRMSWDRDLLDVSLADVQHDSLRSSPQRKTSLSSLPPAPSLSPVKTFHAPVLASLSRSETTVKAHRTSLSLTGGFGANNTSVAGKHTNAMSFQESMDEVEKLLDENVRNRYYDRRQKSPQQIAVLRQAKAKVKPAAFVSANSARSDLSKRSYLEFAPLRDPMVLAAAAAQDAQDEEEDKEEQESANSSNNNNNSTLEQSPQSPRSSRDGGEGNENEFDPDTTTSTQVRLKYFGAGAKTAYYKTYQELHGKSHLFVEKTVDKHAGYSATLSTQSLRIPTAVGANSMGTSASPLRKTAILSSIALTHGNPDDVGDDVRAQQHSSEGLSRISISPFARRRQALQSSDLGPSSALTALAGMESSPSLHSPRVLFLSSCIAKSHLAISILIRKDNCHTYDFSHQGLGDNFIIQFAECLPDLPLVGAINVSDNRLSDNALNVLLLSLENKPNLTKLDISENEIGSKSAKSLRNYIASSLCTIKTLTMNNADVDDQECTLFMIAFEKNKSVEHLYLRSNRIGQILSTKAKVKGPSSSDRDTSSTGSYPLPTGGESIGAMLNVNLNIATLDLSWNLLKFASASPIGNALQLNYNLKQLNLSYNACGDQGAMVFGQTIRINTALEKLNLSYNSIGAKGAMVIASGLAANKGLRELILDGNSIGLESGRALMHASCTRTGGENSICHLSLFECNLTSSVGGSHVKSRQSDGDASKSTKEMTLFNPADPTGEYSLDLSDPYEHMIAHELLQIATFKAEYRFIKLEYSPSLSGGKSASAKIELSRRPKKKPVTGAASSGGKQVVLQNRSPVALLFAQIDKDQSGSVDFQELVQALREHGLNISEERLAILLHEYDYDHNGSLQEDEFHDLFLRCGFAMVDTDHSGSLNADEIENVLRFVGVQDVNPQKIKRMMVRYDLNSSGEIDEHEFLEFMKAEMLRAAQHDEEQSQNSDTREKDLDEAYEAIALREASGVIWKIPTTGLLSVEFDRGHDHHHHGTISASTEGSDDSGRRRSNVFSPGQNVSDAVIAKLVSSVQGVSRNNADQADFLKAVLADSDLYFTAAQAEQLLEKQGKLKSASRKIAALVRILPQMVNRREAISLVVHLYDPKKQWQERFALRRQLGSMYSVLLGSLTNKYCLDLTSADDRAALKKLALIAQEEKLFSKNRSGRSDTSQHGNWENFRNATIDGKVVLLTSTYILNALLAPTSTLQLSSKLGTPSSSVLNPVAKEDVKRRVEFYYVSTTRPPRGTKTLTRRRFEQLLEVLSEPIAEDTTRSTESSFRKQEIPQEVSTFDALEKGRQNAQLRWEIARNSVLRSSAIATRDSSASSIFRVKNTLDRVQQKLDQLEMLMSDRWLHSDQAVGLTLAFPNAINARARAACILFGRLMDVENFIKIYDELSPEDQQECIRCLGWLNIFDPMQPDRQFPPLDLSVRDERELVQILAQLVLNEGQETWQDPAYYNATREVTGQLGPPILIPSAELPPPGWGEVDATGDQSLKHHGIVRVRFRTITPEPDRPSSQQSAEHRNTPSSNQAEFRAHLRSKVLCGTRQYL